MRRALFSAVGCAGILMCAATQAASPLAHPVSDLEKDLLKSVHEQSYRSTKLEHSAETWATKSIGAGQQRRNDRPFFISRIT